MIGARHGSTRSVSGAGGSCFYRALAYQMCEREGKAYHDAIEVAGLRNRVRAYLQAHADDPVPYDAQLTWHELGGYPAGYAELPVPQAMPYVLGRPLFVHLGKTILHYGKELMGEPLQVRLAGEHYTIQYGIRL